MLLVHLNLFWIHLNKLLLHAFQPSPGIFHQLVLFLEYSPFIISFSFGLLNYSNIGSWVTRTHIQCNIGCWVTRTHTSPGISKMLWGAGRMRQTSTNILSSFSIDLSTQIHLDLHQQNWPEQLHQNSGGLPWRKSSWLLPHSACSGSAAVFGGVI